MESNVINFVQFGDGTNMMRSAYFPEYKMGALYICPNQQPHEVNSIVTAAMTADELESTAHFRFQFSNVESIDALIASLEDVKGMMVDVDKFKEEHRCDEGMLNVLSRN